MYVPRFNVMPDEDVLDFLAAHPAGHLVTVDPSGRPDSTLLPLLLDTTPDGRLTRVRAHFARANDHWRRIASGGPAVVVVTGPDAYISPGWYASKAEHGRVVPTWNYSEVQVRGTVHVHDDPEWVREVVTGLTDLHESGRSHPWAVTDAPERYVEGQLRAVVGIELVVDMVEAKAKLSQNRSHADRSGAVEGLSHEARPEAREVADAMRAALGN